MWEYKYSGDLSGDNSDELRHWKYIKKVKKNGKWRYYYDTEGLKDDLGFDERDSLEKAEGEYITRQAVQQHIENKILNPSAMDIKNYGGNPNKLVKDMTEQALNNKRKVSAAKREVDKALRKYEKTPLGKLEGTINKGLQALTRLFGKWRN